MLPDRHMSIPPGRIVKSGYVPIGRVRMACRERMAIGDVERAYRQQLALGSAQAWPPPVGYWDSDGECEVFVIEDGRHTHVALEMLGFTHLFVAWVEG